jgi:hypothetical protein
MLRASRDNLPGRTGFVGHWKQNWSVTKSLNARRYHFYLKNKIKKYLSQNGLLFTHVLDVGLWSMNPLPSTRVLCA